MGLGEQPKQRAKTGASCCDVHLSLGELWGFGPGSFFPHSNAFPGLDIGGDFTDFTV